MFAGRLIFPIADRRGRIPLSLQLNHSLVDGVHVAAFAETLEGLLDAPESL